MTEIEAVWNRLRSVWDAFGRASEASVAPGLAPDGKMRSTAEEARLIESVHRMEREIASMAATGPRDALILACIAAGNAPGCDDDEHAKMLERAMVSVIRHLSTAARLDPRDIGLEVYGTAALGLPTAPATVRAAA